MDIIIYYGTIILGFVIVLFAQLNINKNYSKYKKIKARNFASLIHCSFNYELAYSL